MTTKPRRLVTRLQVAVLCLVFAASVSAQFAGWQQSGSLSILTTPEGADLPAAAVDGFQPGTPAPARSRSRALRRILQRAAKKQQPCGLEWSRPADDIFQNYFQAVYRAQTTTRPGADNGKFSARIDPTR